MESKVTCYSWSVLCVWQVLGAAGLIHLLVQWRMWPKVALIFQVWRTSMSHLGLGNGMKTVLSVSHLFVRWSFGRKDGAGRKPIKTSLLTKVLLWVTWTHFLWDVSGEPCGPALRIVLLRGEEDGVFVHHLPSLTGAGQLLRESLAAPCTDQWYCQGQLILPTQRDGGSHSLCETLWGPIGRLRRGKRVLPASALLHSLPLQWQGPALFTLYFGSLHIF